MYNATEQATIFNKSVIDAALQFSKIAQDTTERIVGIHLEAVKETFESVSETLRPLTAAQDLQTLLDLRAKFTESRVENATAYSRSLCDVVNYAKVRISDLVNGQLAVWNQAVTRNIINGAGNENPVSADLAIASPQSTVAATANTFDGIAKTVNSDSEFSKASVKSAVEAATIVKKATPTPVKEKTVVKKAKPAAKKEKPSANNAKPALKKTKSNGKKAK